MKQKPNKMRRLTIFVLLCLFGFSGATLAQRAALDSLQGLLQQTADDSLRAELYIQMAYAMDEIDREQAIEYSMQAIEILEEHGYNQREAVMLNNVGYYYWQMGRFLEAIRHYQKALTIYEDLGIENGIARVSNNLGAIHWGLSNYNEALDLYQKALKLRKQQGNQRGTSLILNNIGLIYQEWELFEDAFQYHEEALDFANQIGDLFARAYSYNNIGRYYKSTGKYEKALDYYQLSYRDYVDDGGNASAISLSLKNIGDIYDTLKKYEEAISYYRRSLKSAESVNNQFRIAIAEYNLGRVFLKTGNQDSTEYYLMAGLHKAQENGYNELVRDTQYQLSSLAEERGNIANALAYFRTATAVKDSIFNKQKMTKFTELQVRYHTEQQARENALLRKNNEIQRLKIAQQNNVRNALIGAALFILVILALIYNSRRSLKKVNLTLEAQNAEIRTINQEREKLITDLKGEIAERQIAEEKLRQSEAKYRLMVESSRDAVIIVQDDHLLYYNAALPKMLDYHPDKLDSMHFRELISDTAAEQEMERRRQREKGVDVPHRYETEFVSSDGRRIVAEAHVSVVDYQGKPATFAIIRDITQQKKIFETLQSSARQTEGLKDFIPICAGCNKIRDDEKEGHPWISPADYITERLPDVHFSHGMCPDCMKKWYPDFMQQRRGAGQRPQ